MKKLLVIALFCYSSLSAAVPEYDSIRAARPDGRSIAVRDLTLVRDAFTFRFHEGAFHLLTPVDGITFAAVFLGRGSYALDPATESELRHLRLVSGEPGIEVLADSFTELVVFFTDRSADEILAHAAVATGEPNPRAVAVYDDHLRAQKNEIQVNIHLRVLMDLLNRPGRSDGIFVASVDGEEHEPALAIVDPLGISTFAAKFGFFGGEQVALFVYDGPDEGFWYLSAPRGEATNGRGRPVQMLADAEHYAIDSTIDGGEISGVTTIRILSRVDGLRVLPLHILPKLRIRSAGTAGAPDLGIVQEEVELGRFARLFRDEVADADAALVFPAALKKGEPVEVTIEYGGRDVVRSAGGSWSVGARDSWYPNLGGFSDLATYDLTFRVPRRFEIVSVGTKTEERVEGKQRLSIWKTAAPIRIAGFNYGEFRRISRNDDVSGIEVTVYTAPEWTKKAGDAMADALNAARIANLFFGPAPYSHISVTQQVEWNFGQSWPSLVFLPTLALTTSTERVMAVESAGPRAVADVNAFATTVGWHEVAHQWWGHMVGWESYRDQWLSEGLSEFTAALALEFTENRGRYDQFWEQKRKEILEKRGPVANWEAGPISQGFRVGTRRTPQAARAIVYSKGAFVVHMLRMMLRDQRKANPDEAFVAMMRDFAGSWREKNPSTDDFRAVVERHMVPTMDAAGDRSMRWFFDQWVHGTEIPRLRSTLQVSDVGGGKFRIHGTVAQEGVSKEFLTIVPIYLEFGRGQFVKAAEVRLEGSSSRTIDFQAPLPQAPIGISINEFHDVLARE